VPPKFFKFAKVSLFAVLTLAAAQSARAQQFQPNIGPPPAARNGAAFPPPDPHLPQDAQSSDVLPAPTTTQPPYLTQPRVAPSQYTMPTYSDQPQYANQPQYTNQPQDASQPYEGLPMYANQPPYASGPTYLPPRRPMAAPTSPFAISTRFWFRTELLLWWTKAAPSPQPLVTTGSPDDAIPGALGQPGTQTIIGGESVVFPLFSGLRLQSGYWLDDDQTFAIEGEYFFLGKQFSNSSAFSDPDGNPVIARPVINAQTGTEASYVDSLPGSISGGVAVFNSSALQGWEINGAANLFRSVTNDFRVDGLGGFRYLNLTESLEIQDQFGANADGTLTFGGQPISASESLADFDRFRTTNNFYGGMLGARLTWMPGRWVLSATGKVSLGTNQERTVIQGGTALQDFFGTTEAFLPGGVLATTANIGNYYRSPFAVVPEARFNVGFQATPWMTIRVGYSFLFISNVLRPGNQISRVVSPNLVPSDSGFALAGPNLPVYQFHTSTFWAQGLNLGLDFHF
jgi:hypothetical protein